MRHALGLALIVLSTTSSGCALVQDGARNTIVAIKRPFEEHLEKKRNRQWAEAAWGQVCASGAPGTPSEDYAQGFKDGFAEFLFRGGDGEPPLVAPLHYRHIRYQSESGYLAVQDWFAGYRHGSNMARDSGARKWITGPSSLLAQLDAMEAHDKEGLPPPNRDVFEKIEPLPPPQLLPREDQLLPTPPQGNDVGMPPAVRIGTPTTFEVQIGTPTTVVEDVPPLPEPVRLRIMRITETENSPAGPIIINGSPDETRLHITGMRCEPGRPHVTAISTRP